jgi:hypothetical protein
MFGVDELEFTLDFDGDDIIKGEVDTVVLKELVLYKLFCPNLNELVLKLCELVNGIEEEVGVVAEY